MTELTSHDVTLTTATVVAVTEESCITWSTGGEVMTRFAPQFPIPRTERVSPGHLVTIATRVDGHAAIIWRWYDAVVLDGADRDAIRLWEPGHGEVTASATAHYAHPAPGSRAYASAGLDGDGWWVSGPVVDDPADAQVELDAVRALFDVNGMWPAVFGSVD